MRDLSDLVKAQIEEIAIGLMKARKAGVKCGAATNIEIAIGLDGSASVERFTIERIEPLEDRS